jgi:hypothetical protein
MPIDRREFIAASVAGATMLREPMKAFATPPGDIQATIDASKSGAPISPLIFGGYMEPATTQVWAEVLTDRKFANAITSGPHRPRQILFFGGSLANRSSRLGRRERSKWILSAPSSAGIARA